MPLSESEQAALTRLYQARLAGVSARTIPAVDRAWLALGGFRDDDLPGFIAATAPATSAAKAAARALAVGYIAAILSKPPPAVAVTEVPVTYNARSAFLAVRKALSDGHTFTEARTIGQSQAQAAVRNLTISTARQTGDIAVSRTGARVTGWRRTAEAGACPWCLKLDGVIFPSSGAADFGHDRCNCTPLPVAAA